MNDVVKLVGFFLLLQCVYPKDILQVTRQWKDMEFYFPSEEFKLNMTKTGEYRKGASFILDVDVHYEPNGERRIFVTIPRLGSGRPMTLGVVTQEMGEGGPLVRPYPDYSWHVNQTTNCDGITSVLRMKIDECSRLWVVDTGKIGQNILCQPQILAFDLKTDELITRYRISPDIVGTDYLLSSVVVDVQDPEWGCHDTNIYITDTYNSSILVYSLLNDTIWKVTDDTFKPDVTKVNFTVAGENFQLEDGIVGIALSPYKENGEPRNVYYHPLTSVTEGKVNTSTLLDEDAWNENKNMSSKFTLLPGRRPSQTIAEAMDRNGILFFGLCTETAIACWDSSKQYSPKNFHYVSQNQTTLQFPSGMKVVTNYAGEQEFWAVTNRLQKILNQSRNASEVNFRILSAKVKDLVKGTKCDRNNMGGY